jgi:hypothetical protein
MSDTDVQYGADVLHVHVDNTNDMGYPKRPKECRISSRTIVLTAANPFQQAVGIDPGRIETHIEAITNSVIMSHSTGQASDAANQANPFVNPNGRILNSAVGEYVVPGGQNEIWFTANIFPTLVGITVVREF